MICPHCRTSNRESAAFCKECGRRLACPVCATILPSNAKFCDRCGQRLGGVPAALEPVDSGRLVHEAQAGRLPAEEPEAPLAESPPGSDRLAAKDAQKDDSTRSNLEQYIPTELLAKLNAAQTDRLMVGERRVVTILFCDVKGSTAAAEQLDPEDWTEIINGAFEHMIKPVYKYEGTVARLMGDAILAFFGAPIAHEDDPQRAVLAGLSIVEGIQGFRERVKQQWEIDFNVRVGINTGLVVVDAVGSDLRLEYTAMGDAINLAARMEQTAQPGTVQIAQDTYKHVAALFEFEELGGIQVKGKEEPVLAYRVLGRKTQAGRLRGIAGIETPLVGREREMTDLQEAASKLQRGVGGIVGLIGEAGLGKSRLIRELKKARDPSSEVQWFETSSLSYETNQPYNLFRRLIQRVARASPNDPPEVLREKIGTIFENLDLEQRGQMQRVFESLFGLVGAGGEPPLEGETFKKLFYSATRSLWQARASQVPTVLVCDDLHWADSASVELLAELFSLTEDVPLLLACSLRPERQSPGWKLKNTADSEYLHRYTELVLKPLSEAESGQLLESLTQGAELPDSLLKRILDRAAGVPYYIEEVVRSLMDSRALERENGYFRWVGTGDFTDIDLPDSLQTLLVARIDRLQEEARRTLQLASVIGRSFYYRVLEQIKDAASAIDTELNQLVRANMIREAAREPELEYTFSNVLTQEAAYQTILLRHRRRFHQQVGEALETLFPDRRGELAPVLAVHFSEAGDDERTLIYRTLAGDAAFRVFALDEAVKHYRAALEIGLRGSVGAERKASSQQLSHLYTRLGRAYELLYQYDKAQKTYESMREEAERNGDQALKLAYLIALGTVYVTHSPLHDPEAGQSYARQALDLAEALGDRRAEAKAHWNLLLFHRFITGDMEAARRNGEAALEIARDLAWEEQLAFTLNDLAFVYLGLRNLQRTMLVLDEARDLWRNMGNLPMLTDNLNVSAVMYSFAGDFDRSIEMAEEGLQLADTIGSKWNKPPVYWNMSRSYRERGEFELAAQYARGAVTSEENIYSLGMAFSYFNLGLMQSDLGLVQPGFDLCRQGLDIVEEVSSPQDRFDELFYALQGRLHLLEGDLDAAQQAIGRTHLKPADSLVFPFIDLYLVPLVSEVNLGLDETENVLKICGEFAALLEDSGVQLYIPEIYYDMGRAFMVEEKVEEACKALSKARQVAENTGARRVLWQILAALAEIEDRGGNPTAAASLRAEARQVITYIADHIEDEETRAAFLARTEVQSVLGNGDK